MASDFDTFMSASLDDAVAIIGGKTFSIQGKTYTACGILNEFTSARELAVGGFVGLFDGTLVVARSQFSETNVRFLERDLDGKLLTIEGRVFKIAKVAMDETSVTLGLIHPK